METRLHKPRSLWGVFLAVMASVMIFSTGLTTFAATKASDTIRKDNSGTYQIDNESYHSIAFSKKSSYDQQVLDGAIFRLQGTSDKGTKADQYAVSGIAQGKSNSAIGSLYVGNKASGYKVSTTNVSGYTKIADILSKTTWTDTNAYMVQAAVKYAMENGTYGNSKSESNYGMSGAVSFGELESGTYVLTEVSAPTITWGAGDKSVDSYNVDSSKYAVVIKADGTYTIGNLTKESTGYTIYDSKIPTNKIVVKKIWKDGLSHKPEDLAITITTETPTLSSDLPSITFKANGGYFGSTNVTENKVIWSGDKNTALSGTYTAPKNSNAKATFLGWATSSSATSGSTDYKSLIPSTGGKTLYAVWKTPIVYKYAVQLYGIEEDYVQNAEGKDVPGGLTFGPAIGDNYTQKYKAHLTKDKQPVASNMTSKRCIHWDDWDTIIAHNDTNPSVYSDCIAGECTRTVELTLTDENSGSGNVFAKNAYTSSSNKVTSDGDGAGILFFELNDTARQWNNTDGTYLNYGNSKIRAMLNGYNSVYSKDGSGDEVVLAESDFNSGNSLLSAFPTELQNAIGARAVKYRGPEYKSTEVVTCYDKLWLFAASEIWHDGTKNTISGKANMDEGTQYQRTKDFNTYANSSRGDVRAAAYDSSGNVNSWWLRSRHSDYSYRAFCVNSYGGWNSDYVVDDSDGVAPGFVLAR